MGLRGVAAGGVRGSVLAVALAKGTQCGQALMELPHLCACCCTAQSLLGALACASNSAVGNLDSTATSEAIRAEFSKCAGGAGCSAVSGAALASAPLLLPQCCCLCVLAMCCCQCSCFDHLQLTGPPAWNPHPHRFGPLLQWQVAPPKLPGSTNLRYAIVSFRKLQDAQAAFDALNKQVGGGGAVLCCFR